MFYLRTGANGSCKTLLTLRDVRDLQLATGRPVAHNGRFKIHPHIEQEFGWKKIDFKKWQDEPDGTIFLVDEVYYDLPVRPNGQQPPEYVAKLAEHRARGFDFFMLCLHPSQIDMFIRKAIGAPGYHQHLKRVGGATKLTRVLQWDTVNDNCQKDGSGKTAQISNRLQPKEVYDWYDSAFLHTGKVRIPKQVWWFVGGLLVAIVLAVFAYRALSRNVFKGANPNPQASGTVTAAAPGANTGSDKPRPLTAAEYAASFQPRIQGLPHTAPRYDEVTRPVQAPKPAACVDGVRPGAKVRTCSCWSQQATALDVPEALCRQIAAGGFFDDTLPVEHRASDSRSLPARSAAAPSTAEPSSLSVMASSSVLPPPQVVSTVSRDAEVLAFMAKRRQHTN